MRPPKLRARIAMSFLGLVAVVACAVYLAFRHDTRKALVESVDLSLRAHARRVALEGDARDEPWDRRAPGAPFTGGHVVLDPGDLHTITGAASLHDVVLPPGLLRKGIRAGPEGEFATFADTAGTTLRAFARMRRASHDTAPVLVVTVASLATVDHEMEELATRFAASLPVALAIALAASLFLARGLTRPLVSMADAASSIEASGVQIAVRGTGAGDELDRLAGTLNRAFARLQAAFERQGRFTADAAHELRTPVAAIRGRAEVALRHPRTPDEYRAALGDIHDSARRAGDTLEGLLALARIDAGRADLRGPVDVVATVRGELEAARARHPAATLRIGGATQGEEIVAGNAAQIATAVRDLVENALTHGASCEGVDVEIAATEGEVEVRVADRGPGVPPDEAERVFERFHRLDPSRSRRVGGSGLGLSIVRAVAELHGGEATIVARAGGGVVARLRLPRTR